MSEPNVAQEFKWEANYAHTLLAYTSQIACPYI